MTAMLICLCIRDQSSKLHMIHNTLANVLLGVSAGLKYHLCTKEKLPEALHASSEPRISEYEEVKLPDRG